MMESLLKAVEQAIEHDADTFTALNWNMKRIYGGMNGIIYRVEDSLSPEHPMAVKIRKRDERNRALREFSVLQALSHLSEPVAPQPISLHTDIATLPGDVVISSWVDGTVLNDLTPISFDLWESILNTFSRIHSVRPTNAPSLLDAVQPIRSTTDLILEIERRYAKLPDGQIGEITKADIGHLLAEFKVEAIKNSQPAKQIGLISCDTNPSNMIENKGQILFVDWENAGWGDPAFDIADLLVRPNCKGISADMHTRIIQRYAEMMENPELPQRILVYERLMFIFWLVLTSGGFAVNNTQRFRGIRTFTVEQSTQQQLDYLQRIEAARSQ